MVAAAVEVEQAQAEATMRPVAEVPAPRAPGDVDAAADLQAHARAAERSLGRAAVRGVLIGMPVCAVIWTGIVGLALAVAGGGWGVLPALGMGAVVGLFAGAFFGGWAGVTAKAHELDEAERRIVRRA